MTPYLIGIIGALGGGVVALIYALKHNKVKNKLTLAQNDYKSLSQRHKDLGAEHTDYKARTEAENRGIRKENEELHEKINELRVASKDPAELNRALNSMFKLPKDTD